MNLMTESRQKLLMAGLLLGIFLAAVDSTVVAVAMPSIVSSLQGLEIYSWAFTAYILTSTVSGPLWGRFSDVYGRKTVYLVGLGLFLAGSLLCGLASNMLQLIVFRAVQGLGGGALLILTFTLIGELFSLKERARATGYTSSVWASASIVGPPLGGLIVDSVGWRWIFLINVPAGVVCMLIGLKQLRNTVDKEARVDVRGAVLFMAAATALLVYLNEAEAGGMPVLMLLLSGAAFTLFIYNERRSEAPLIPLQLFRENVLRTGFMGNFLAGFIFFGIIAYMPLYLQWALSFSATNSGMLLLPLVLGWVAAANMAARVVIRSSVKTPVYVSGIALVAGSALLTMLGLGLPVTLTGLALIGLGMGFTVSTFLITTQTLVPRSVLGVATSLLSFLRLIGGAIAVAVMWIPLSSVVRRVEVAGDPQVVLTAVEKAQFVSALGNSMIIALAAALTTLVLYLFIPNVKLSSAKQA
ncbi:MAG: MFS transporter [Candidatus Caldarchaeum sp.]|uniref:MFS-type drug efflux transporter P55 n=1 Tax=Caldiarchaeum subterraneum TaxID=311458 RepID=A0A7J3VRU7_CALS0